MANRLVFFLELFALDNLGTTHDNTARVKVIVKSFDLAKELWREKKIELLYAFSSKLHVEITRLTHRNGS